MSIIATLRTIILNAIPYVAGFAASTIAWIMFSFGVPPVVAVTTSLILLMVMIMPDVLDTVTVYLNNRIKELEQKTLPISIPTVDEIDYTTVPKATIALVEFEDTETIPFKRNKLIASTTDPNRTTVAVMVDSIYVRTMSFPVDRKIIHDAAGLQKHARKYRDVARTINNRTVVGNVAEFNGPSDSISQINIITKE